MMTMVNGTINGSAFKPHSNRMVRAVTGSGLMKPYLKALDQTSATLSRWRLSQLKNGWNPRCLRISRRLLPPTHRSSLCGWMLRQWHAGIGSAGYVQPNNPKHVGDGSRRHVRSSVPESKGHVALTVPPVPNPLSRETGCSSTVMQMKAAKAKNEYFSS